MEELQAVRQICGTGCNAAQERPGGGFTGTQTGVPGQGVCDFEASLGDLRETAGNLWRCQGRGLETSHNLGSTRKGMPLAWTVMSFTPRCLYSSYRLHAIQHLH